MKKIFLFIQLFLIIIFFSVSNIKAQNLEETLSNLSSGAGKAYVAPVISAFGSNLNSGWVSKVPEAVKFKLHLNLKFIAAGSFFSDENKKFNANGDFYFTSSQVDQILENPGFTQGNPNYNSLKNAILEKQFTVQFSGPTIVGSEKEKLNILFPQQQVQANGQTFTIDSYTLAVDEVKGLLDEISILPTPGIQLTGGTVLGTNIAIRYSPKIKVSDDLGDFSLWGIGAIHNPGAFFLKPLPIDIAVSFFSQSMKVGDIFESSSTQFGIYAGKTFGNTIAFSPFIGLTTESSKTTVKYDYQSNQTINGVQVPPTKINFELEGENSTGVTIGFNLKLSFFNINADYKIAKTKTASAGISFGI